MPCTLMHYLEMNDDPRTPEQKLSAQFVYLNRRNEITVSVAKRKLCVPLRQRDALCQRRRQKTRLFKEVSPAHVP